jgi:Amt family ammonium transporter
MLGTVMVGFFSLDGGLFYGHGVGLLASQLLGAVTVGGWAFIAGFFLFKLLKISIGLRVPKRIEEEGLDIYEHGESAYN